MIQSAPTVGVWLAAFARASAFSATAPIAGSGGIPKAVRAALALVLAPAVAAHVEAGAALGAACLLNAVDGAAFGLAAAVVASAAVAAGGIIDAAVASQAIGRETVFGGGSGPFGRLMSLGFATAFFASGSMTHLCSRFVDASSSVTLALTISAATALIRACIGASLTLAAPSIVAALLGTAMAAVIARATPKINGMTLASPLATALILAAMIASAPVTFVRFADLSRAVTAAPR